MKEIEEGAAPTEEATSKSFKQRLALERAEAQTRGGTGEKKPGGGKQSPEGHERPKLESVEEQARKRQTEATGYMNRSDQKADDVQTV